MEAGTTELTHEAAAVCGSQTVEQAQKDPKMLAYLEGALKAVNTNQEVVASNAAKIQKFQILPHDFSVVGEELTPTLKVKRSFITDKYSKYVDAMY